MRSFPTNVTRPVNPSKAVRRMAAVKSAGVNSSLPQMSNSWYD